jgi:hypothetical protein
MRRYEIAFAIALLLVVLGSWGLDRAIPTRAVAGAALPTSSAPLSEAWYCPVPTSQGLGSTVETANLARSGVNLRQSGLGAGAGTPAESDLAPGALTSSQAAPSGPSPAEVEAFGGRTFSYLSSVAATVGGATERCSEQPGARWLFAEASTAAGYDTYLFIANPFQEQAAVTIRVLGSGGDTVPSGLSNYQIPPTSQTGIFLGDYYPETQSFGLDVTANRGRVLVARMMKVASQDGTRGLAMDLGAPAPATQWIFPGGQVPSQGEEEVLVANPSSHEALVSESFLTSGGGAPAGQQNVAVPAGEQIAITSSDQVPAGTQHGTIISSVNGVPVVAERTTIEGSGSSRGFETVFGVPSAGASWVVPVGSPVGGTDTLGVVAAGVARATYAVTLVSGTASVSPSALANLTVDPGTRASVDLTPYLGGQPGVAVVRASSGSIAVENDDALPAAYRETMESVGSPAG